MASIKKRGDLQWRARIRRRGHPVQTKTFETKAGAEAWARQVEGEMDRGVFVSRALAESTTLAEALTRYQAEVTSTKKGFAEEISVLKRWKALPLACHMLATVRSQDLATIRDEWLKKGSKPGTIVRRFAILSHVFTIARKEWGMDSLSNPTHNVRPPAVDNARTRRLVHDEQARLLTAAQAYGGRGTSEIGPLIIWAIETAMRRGEIAAMRWERINWQTHVLTVPWEETKTSEARSVPLSRAALTVLNTLPRHTDGPVWSLRAGSISQAFTKTCKVAGIKGLTFHDLRHEATSRLFEKGLNVMEVASITGHRNLQNLKRYTHLRAEDLVDRLD
ncbi:MAG: tyrosine-type recombinase/integrase [Acidiferrobacter sp.]